MQVTAARQDLVPQCPAGCHFSTTSKRFLGFICKSITSFQTVSLEVIFTSQITIG
jgi:hypothetical protein